MKLRLPTVKIGGLAEFERWFAQARPVLDQRWLYERQQIEAGLSATRDGTCGICLNPARFSSPAPADQRNWREEMLCGCPHQLNNRQRALLHFLRAHQALSPALRAAVVGPETALEAKLAAWGLRPRALPRLIAGRLAAADGAFDAVICGDYLQFVLPALAMLHELARVARPGAVLVLTVPFDVGAAQTLSRAHDLPPEAMESAEPLHLFGWDLLDGLRDAGFYDVAAHFYWSDEFGYLGPFNMIVSGVRL